MAKGIIYKFSLDKKEKQKVEVVRKNKETGEEETVIQNKTVKVPVEFVIKKPTRRLIDEAETQYAAELSKNVRQGIVTRAMLAKKYSDVGGAMTDEDAKTMVRQIQRSNEISNEIQLLSATDGDKAKIKELEAELITIRQELAEVEVAMQGVYEHTADARAERAMLLWYTIQLSKKIVDEKEETFFKGLLYEDQLEDLYLKDEEGDEIEQKALKKFMTVVSYWFYNNDINEEAIEEFLNKQENG
tara:strand:- start:219 stop:950 length:732 start_codon:yes stop_codon:yes gene_type:complete